MPVPSAAAAVQQVARRRCFAVDSRGFSETVGRCVDVRRDVADAQVRGCVASMWSFYRVDFARQLSTFHVSAPQAAVVASKFQPHCMPMSGSVGRSIGRSSTEAVTERVSLSGGRPRGKLSDNAVEFRFIVLPEFFSSSAVFGWGRQVADLMSTWLICRAARQVVCCSARLPIIALKSGQWLQWRRCRRLRRRRVPWQWCFIQSRHSSRLDDGRWLAVKGQACARVPGERAFCYRSAESYRRSVAWPCRSYAGGWAPSTCKGLRCVYNIERGGTREPASAGGRASGQRSEPTPSPGRRSRSSGIAYGIDQCIVY